MTTMRTWELSEKGRAHRAEYQRVWEETPVGRAFRHAYNNSIERKAYLKLRNDTHKAMAFEYLGGVCSHCGTDESLEFDHIDRSTKSYKISRRYTSAWKTLVKELDKCQLLCHSCHAKKTKAERSQVA